MCGRIAPLSCSAPDRPAYFDQTRPSRRATAVGRTQRELVEAQAATEGVTIRLGPHHVHQLDQLTLESPRLDGVQVVVVANGIDSLLHARGRRSRARTRWSHRTVVVVEDVRGAESAHQIEVVGRARSDDRIHPEITGKLQAETAHAAGSADHQERLAGLDVQLVYQAAIGCPGGARCSRGLDRRNVGWGRELLRNGSHTRQSRRAAETCCRGKAPDRQASSRHARAEPSITPATSRPGTQSAFMPARPASSR